MFLLATAALVVWIIVWLIVAYRVVIRHDLGVAAKVLWIVLILIFTIISSTSVGLRRSPVKASTR